MLYPFLCPTHREWLTDNITAANNHYAQCIDTAQFYVDSAHWNSALPYCGSAFETAEIILNAQPQEMVTATINFTHAAILLANGFRQLGMMTERQDVFEQSRERLRVELQRHRPDPQLHPALLECYASLDLGYQGGIMLNKEKGENDDRSSPQHAAHSVH